MTTNSAAGGYLGGCIPGGIITGWEEKTGSFVAQANIGYFIDTTGGPFTGSLPSTAEIGDTIAFSDAASNFNDSNFTVGRNGNTIMNVADDLVLNLKNQAVVLVFVSDGDWRITESIPVGIPSVAVVASDSTIVNNTFWVDSSDSFKLKWKDNSGTSKEVNLT